MIRAKLSSTNETSGVFEQTKMDVSGRTWVTKGVFTIRPGVDFEWRTTEPFETKFYATPERYTYSNEDESVTRKLSELPGFEKIPNPKNLDLTVFFEMFDALYKEENGRFFVKAKPKEGEIKRVLDRVEAEGMVSNWMFKATFPNGMTLKIDLREK